MEQLNYRKLVNLKKRFEKYDCISSKKILNVIEECMVIEKQKSKEKDKERRLEYMLERVQCEVCGKEVLRNNIYKHKKIHE